MDTIEKMYEKKTTIKAPRRILNVRKSLTTVNGTERVHRLTVVWWCLGRGETSRTIKTDHIACSVYLDGKFRGTEARFPRKITSLNKRAPLESYDLEREAFGKAYSTYISSLKDLKGIVRWFDRARGKGVIRIPELNTSFQVFACNLPGAKTGFAETSCVYLIKGESVLVDHIHDYCGAVIKDSENVHFDQEQWDRLDQDRLAFKRGPDGKFLNGLF